MKKRNLLKTLFAALISVSMLVTTVMASPTAVAVFDSSSEDIETADLSDTGDYALSVVNKPGTTFVLSRDEYTYDVCDMWNEIDSDGTGELKFDQSFSVNINNAVDAYNNYLDTNYPNGERDQYKASEDIHNGSIFYVEARVLINNYEYQFSSKASYQYAPYGLDGEYNEGCGEWNISSYYDELSDFFTMSSYDGVLDLSLNGTVKEIYEALKAQDETLGDVTINNLEFQLRISCEVEYRGSWGNINYTEYGFEGLSLTLYDKHIYESASEYDILPVIPTSSPITVNVAPAIEGCYEPVKAEYDWYYEFVKEGYDTDEDDKWYGYFERDESKESDVLTETAPSGALFGVAYGKIDSGDKNYITLNDILNENNKAFINSFIGVKSMEFGGAGQISIVCVVTLTFEDGKQFRLSIQKADYSSYFMAPCMHACTVCGFCTITDEILPCNFDQMNYDITNVCVCEEPTVPEYEITLESEKTVTIESTERPVKVVVEKIEVEETPTHSFIINATEAVGEDNVVALYNVNIFDEEGYPYTLNQWYDEGEELTVTLKVGEENAVAIAEGAIKVYHVSANGDIEEVTDITVDGDTISFVWSDFSPFVLAYASDSDGIEINLGAKADATNVRYVEIDGVVIEITEDNNKYIPEIGEDNLLIEVVEKTQSGEFVKSQYFYVEMENETSTKLSMDSYMKADGNTSIRTNNPMGIRFKSSVITAVKDEETQFVVDEYGFIVATEEALGDEELTLNFSKYVTGVAYNKENGTDIVFDASDDEAHVFAGYVKNIPVANYKTNLVCKTYTKITVGGEQFTVYGEAVTGNVYNTAKTLLEDETLDTETKNALINITLAYENTIGIPGDDLYPES